MNNLTNQTGLEKMVEWISKYHPSHYTVKMMRGKAQSLLAEEKAKSSMGRETGLAGRIGRYARELHGEESDKHQQQIADELKGILADYARRENR